LGQKARDRAVNGFAQQIAIDSYIELYERLRAGS
jgi:hypothetical protein